MVNIGDEISADEWVGTPSLKTKLESIYTTLGLDRVESCGVNWQEWDSIQGEDSYGEDASEITINQMDEMKDRIIFAWENRCGTHNNQDRTSVENTNYIDEQSTYNLEVKTSDNLTYREEHCHVAFLSENITYRVSVDTSDNEIYFNIVESTENVNEYVGENAVYDASEKNNDNDVAETTDFSINYEAHEDIYDLDCSSHKNNERFDYDSTDNSPHYNFAWTSVNSPENSADNPSHLGIDFDGDKITYNDAVWNTCGTDCTETNVSYNTDTNVTYRSTHRGNNFSSYNSSQDFNDNSSYDTGTVTSYESSTVSGYNSTYKISYKLVN